MQGFQEKNIIGQGVTGGRSEFGNRGARGSFRFGRCLDIHGEFDTLKPQRRTLIDGNSLQIIDQLPVAIVKDSVYGNIYVFGQYGKIWRKKAGSSTYTLVFNEDSVPVTTSIIIGGAIEYQSNSDKFLMWSYGGSAGKLRKITLANADGTWSGNVSTAGSLTTYATYEPKVVREAFGAVVISDKNYLAMYDEADAFNAAALILPPDRTIKDIETRGEKIYILNQDSHGNGFITDWDGESDSWISDKKIGGLFPTIIQQLESGIIAHCDTGNIKYFDFLNVSQYRKINNAYSYYPNAKCMFHSMQHVGMQGTDGGIYSIGRTNKSDPIAINLEYVVSNEADIVYVKIGSLCVDTITDTMYIGMEDTNGAGTGTPTYGIFTVSTLKQYAYYQSLEENFGTPNIEKTLGFVGITCRPLPTGCSIKLRVRSPGEAWPATYLKTAAGNESVTVGKEHALFSIGNKRGYSFEFFVELYATSAGVTYFPEVTAVVAYYKNVSET